jgi:hypothetical protein
MFTTFADRALSAAAEAVGIDAVVDKSHGANNLITTVEQLLAQEGTAGQA